MMHYHTISNLFKVGQFLENENVPITAFGKGENN